MSGLGSTLDVRFRAFKGGRRAAGSYALQLISRNDARAFLARPFTFQSGYKNQDAPTMAG
jgi:hypothetical protein